MSAFFITAAIITAAAAILINIPLLLEISYGIGRHKEKTEVWLRYSLFSIRLYPPKKKKNEKSEKNEKPKKNITFSDFSANITNAKNGYNILRGDIIKFIDYLVKKGAVFKKIELDAEFGLEDACSTGIAYGIINAAVYGILGFLHNTFTINDWSISLTPDFKNQRTDVYILCILKTRLRHIFKMLYSIALMYMKYNKSTTAAKNTKNTGKTQT